MNPPTESGESVEHGIAAHAFTGALSAAANGVSIVTAGSGQQRAGLTVSSMCSVCAEPPLVLVCVNADNEFGAVVDASGHFVINLLEQRHVPLALVFAGLAPEASDADRIVDRFATGDWLAAGNGAPRLGDALVALECTLDSSLLRGTHRVFFGLVTAVHVGAGNALVYTSRSFVTTTPHV